MQPRPIQHTQRFSCWSLVWSGMTSSLWQQTLSNDTKSVHWCSCTFDIFKHLIFSSICSMCPQWTHVDLLLVAYYATGLLTQVILRLDCDDMVWSPQSPVSLLYVWLCLYMFACMFRGLPCNVTTTDTGISSLSVLHRQYRLLTTDMSLTS